MKKTLIGFVFVALSSAFVIGCGNLSSAPNGFTAGTRGTHSSPPTRTLQPMQNVTVEIHDSFGSSPLVIPKGTSVTWVNDDPVEHTATSDTGAFNSGTLAPNGGSYTFTFSKPGTYPYHSNATDDLSHPMTSQIKVTSSSRDDTGNGPDPTTSVSPVGPIPTFPDHDCKQCQQQQQKPIPKPTPKPHPKPTKPMPRPTLY